MASAHIEETATSEAAHHPSTATARRVAVAAARTVGWLLGPLLLMAAVLFLFRPAIVDGMIYYRPDTFLYYFPLAD
ncbi:MAG TPA: hypothetical protein VF960_13100, partial [Chloroflexota bacterium]